MEQATEPQATAAFRKLAGARFYDLHLLRLVNSRMDRTAFVQYVRENFVPVPADEDEVNGHADVLLQYLFQSQWTRIIDAFQTYVVDVLREILRSKPQIMMSSDAKLTFQEVLTATDLESLVKTMVERTVRPLVGLTQLEQWFEKRKIPLVMTPEERKFLGEAIATRNIIVHNGAVVNEQYLDEAPWRGFELGQLRGISFEDLFFVEHLVSVVSSATDVAIVEKFGLGASPA